MNKLLTKAIIITTTIAAFPAMAQGNEPLKKGEPKMQYVTLNNGMVVPQLGFGTWTLKGEATKESVKRAFEKNDPETFPW